MMASLSKYMCSKGHLITLRQLERQTCTRCNENRKRQQRRWQAREVDDLFLSPYESGKREIEE
jgi:hypothetical protein